ncbi:MAG: hypothetical protein R2705_00535 [Ilumatobacteraceae bacterium]
MKVKSNVVQFVGAHVGREFVRGRDPRLGDEDPFGLVLLGDLAPGPVDVVDPRLVLVGPRLRVGREQGVVGRIVDVGKRRVLDHSVGDVDAETVGTEVEPEPQDVAELRSDLGVLPVEVGLLRSEQMQVPLPG